MTVISSEPQPMSPRVLLVHGMGRSARCWWRLACALRLQGFVVEVLNYPSTRQPIDKLLSDYLVPALERITQSEQPVAVVTHSLGGILMRQFLLQHQLPIGSRLIMLAPPNQGSPIPDTIGHWRLYRFLLGEAGQRLGQKADAWPLQLTQQEQQRGTFGYPDLMVLAGTFCADPWFKPLFKGQANDGKVSLESTKLFWMQTFVSMPYGHTALMWRKPVIQSVLNFLQPLRSLKTRHG